MRKRSIVLKKAPELMTALLLRALWPGYIKAGNEHSPTMVFRCWFIQKVLRVNSHVPWPVHPTSQVSRPDNIFRGSRTPGLSPGCHIDGRNGIVFKENVWVGPYVSIISMNHDVNNYHKYVVSKPVIVGENCWLGAHAIILPGVELGSHTVVAAGAVVTRSFPDGNQLLAGVPAKCVKKLDTYEE